MVFRVVVVELLCEARLFWIVVRVILYLGCLRWLSRCCNAIAWVLWKVVSTLLHDS